MLASLSPLSANSPLTLMQNGQVILLNSITRLDEISESTLDDVSPVTTTGAMLQNLFVGENGRFAKTVLFLIKA
jgi:hypothetical protein